MIEDKFSIGDRVRIVYCSENERWFKEKFVGTTGRVNKMRTRGGLKYYIIDNNDGFGREYLANELEKINDSNFFKFGLIPRSSAAE